jgi:hypothetical protein
MSQMLCYKVPYGVSIVCIVYIKSSGIIYWSPPPSSLPDKLSMNKKDSNGFFST